MVRYYLLFVTFIINKARIRIRAFLLLLVLVFLQINILTDSANAFLSSLDACASQPNCSSSLAAELGIAKNAIAGTAAKTITVTATNTTTGVISTTTVQAVGGLTAAAAGGTLAYLSAEKVKGLQEKGIANYCANNSASCSDFLFIHQVMSGGELSSYEILKDGHKIRVELVRSDGTKFIRETTSNSAYKFTHAENHPFGGRVIVYVHSVDIFNSLSEENRAEIINSLPISDLVQAVEVVDLNLPDVEPGQEIVINTDLLIDDGEVVENPDKDKSPPAPTPNPESNPIPDPESNPISDPEPNPVPDPESTPPLAQEPSPIPDPESTPLSHKNQVLPWIQKHFERIN